jgi:glycosyltransferase involved in cell wall biosynthesis
MTPSAAPHNPALAVVVIGRNEGERLRRCIDTLIQQTAQIVYVDSGSTDGSCDMARSRKVHIVDLDMTKPFSAARARNEGFAAMRSTYPQATVVQFVDGDCDVHPQWLAAGQKLLQDRPDVVAVFGKLSERHPEKSIYNLQCHLTWNPAAEGETEFFGGNIMLRVPALVAAKGFREDVIDSEDHELAIRMRAAGGKVWYLDHPMAIHDLAVYEFSKWWTRTMRGGFGNGQILALHSDAPGKPHLKDWQRSYFWGLVVPLATLVGVVFFGWLGAWWVGLLPLGLYPLSILRMFMRSPAVGGRNIKYAGLTMLSKFAETQGQLRFWRKKLLKQRATIIEYK